MSLIPDQVVHHRRLSSGVIVGSTEEIVAKIEDYPNEDVKRVIPFIRSRPAAHVVDLV